MRRISAFVTAAVLVLAALAMSSAPAQEADEPEAPVKLIKMYAENWKWTPDTIRVPVGTKLRIQFESRDASHSFDLKAYKIKLLLPEGSKDELEFVADKVGEFKWVCGRPCGDGCNKMVGKLIVE